jgi:hypothetical protein
VTWRKQCERINRIDVAEGNEPSGCIRVNFLTEPSNREFCSGLAELLAVLVHIPEVPSSSVGRDTGHLVRVVACFFSVSAVCKQRDIALNAFYGVSEEAAVSIFGGDILECGCYLQ